MNKAFLALLVVVLLIVGGIFYYTSTNETLTSNENSEQTENTTGGTSNEPENNNETSGIVAEVDGSVSLEGDMIEDVIVRYTDNGFSPQTVSINEGQTVRFINESSRGMWVGADPHPVHTSYPEKSPTDCLGSSFDSCRSVPAGGTYSFTFDEVGTWGYHNHTQASHKGSVTVR